METRGIPEYYHYPESAEPGILFLALLGGAERTLRNEGRAGEN